VRSLFLTASVMLLAGLQPGLAAETDADFLACVGIGGAAKRLACYDRVARSLQQVPDADQPAFTPNRPLHVPRPTPQQTAVTVDVVSFSENDGKPVFRLANGQVWEGEDDDAVFPDPLNNKVTISRSALGLGYHLRMNEETREMAVRRIR
jgi:hypothetical protein